MNYLVLKEELTFKYILRETIKIKDGFESSQTDTGYSGASLQNLLNEAAIYTARKGITQKGNDEIETAIDKNLVGLEKKNVIQSLKQKELVAFHEAGHAVCGAMIPDYDQVQKITIIPRSNGAGGLTFFAPSESRIESGHYSRQYLESLSSSLGGRLAEELI